MGLSAPTIATTHTRLELVLDARDTIHRVMRVTESFEVPDKKSEVVVQYPKWIPGSTRRESG